MRLAEPSGIPKDHRDATHLNSIHNLLGHVHKFIRPMLYPTSTGLKRITFSKVPTDRVPQPYGGTGGFLDNVIVTGWDLLGTTYPWTW